MNCDGLMQREGGKERRKEVISLCLFSNDFSAVTMGKSLDHMINLLWPKICLNVSFLHVELFVHSTVAYQHIS